MTAKALSAVTAPKPGSARVQAQDSRAKIDPDEAFQPDLGLRVPHLVVVTADPSRSARGKQAVDDAFLVADTPVDQWEIAQRQLAAAEIELLRWILHRSESAPQSLTTRVQELRDRSNFLFDAASSLLASTNNTRPADLEPWS